MVLISVQTRLMGKAYDVFILIVKRNVNTAQLRLEMVIRQLNEWMRTNGMPRVLGKKEIVVLTRKIVWIIAMRVGELEIETEVSSSILGWWMAARWASVSRYTALGATRGVVFLGRLVVNVGDHGIPGVDCPCLLLSLLYGAEGGDHINTRSAIDIGSWESNGHLRCGVCFCRLPEL